MPNAAPLTPEDARALIREVIEHGELRWSRHAMQELATDDLESSDALNVLRAGVVEPAEWENGEWRYRVRTARMMVVIAFVEGGLRVVTAWRIKR